jgi:uncharacterized protein YkwD
MLGAMAPLRVLPVLAAAGVLVGLAAPSGAVAAPCSGADVQPSPANLTTVATATHCLLNHERAARGLHRTRSNKRLRSAALSYSRRMVAESFFAHVAPDGQALRTRLRLARYIKPYDGYVVGENLAWASGTQSTPRAIVSAWMASPGHRANVLHPRYTEIGLGFVMGTPADRSQGATVTANYGTRDAG